MSKGYILCVVCASRTMTDLRDAKLQLVCTDTQPRKARCDCCGKQKTCLGYEIRTKEA